MAGSIVPMALVPKRSNQGRPSAPITIPYGRERGTGTSTTRTAPVAGSSRPTRLLCCSVNQTLPSGPNTMVCGSRDPASGIGKRVIRRVRPSIRPIIALRLPAYQASPRESTTTVCGWVPGSATPSALAAQVAVSAYSLPLRVRTAS